MLTTKQQCPHQLLVPFMTNCMTDWMLVEISSLGWSLCQHILLSISSVHTQTHTENPAIYFHTWPGLYRPDPICCCELSSEANRTRGREYTLGCSLFECVSPYGLKCGLSMVVEYISSQQCSLSHLTHLIIHSIRTQHKYKSSRW